MANEKTVKDYDAISYCGSLTGGTISARLRNRNCSLRQHQNDHLAKQLKDYAEDGQTNFKTGHTCNITYKGKPRFNTRFHHYRYFVIMMGGMMLGFMLFLRYNITVSILKMVNQTHLYMQEHPNKTIDDFYAEGYSPGGEFLWDNEIQHMIMSGYMIAYTLPQVMMTKFGINIGAYKAIAIALFGCGLANIITPPVAYLGDWEWLIVVRLLNGISASSVVPLTLVLIEQWMPPSEASLGLTILQMCQGVLIALNPPITGSLASIHWSWSFYVSGAIALVLVVIWLLTVTNHPDDNFFVSEKELKLLCNCPKKEAKKDGKSADDNHGVQEIQPGGRISDIFRVPCFYALLLLWCFHCTSYSNFNFVLPTYLRQFLKISIATNGLYCFIIHCGCQVAILWPHPMLKLLGKKLSTTNTHRVGVWVVCSGVALTWITVGLLHEKQVLLFFLNRCFHPGIEIVITTAIMHNYSHAGMSSIVYSMINTVGCMTVVFSSTSIGWLLDKTGQSEFGWTIVFVALGSMHFLMAIIFSLFLHADPIILKGQRELIEAKKRDQKVEVITDGKKADQNPFGAFEETRTKAESRAKH